MYQPFFCMRNCRVIRLRPEWVRRKGRRYVRLLMTKTISRVPSQPFLALCAGITRTYLDAIVTPQAMCYATITDLLRFRRKYDRLYKSAMSNQKFFKKIKFDNAQ